MSLNNNIDNNSNYLFNSAINFSFNDRNLSVNDNTNKNIILKVNPKIKSTGINFQGINIEERNGNCQYLTLNAHPDFSSLSLEELRYNDYSLNLLDFQSNLKNDNINFNQESNNILSNSNDKDNLFISRNNNDNLDISMKNEALKFKNNEEINEDDKNGIIPDENFIIEMSDNYHNNSKNNQNSLIHISNISSNLKSEMLLYNDNYTNNISNISENKFNINSYNPKVVFCENNNYRNENKLNDSRNIVNSLQPKALINQIGNNDISFLNNNFCRNSNRINDENDNDIIEQNDNGSLINMNMNNDRNSLVINMDKNKNNKINIEINDNKINIRINSDINIDINSSKNSLSISTNSINISSNKNSISINTNNNAINNKSNFHSINVVGSKNNNNIINNCKNIINQKDYDIRNLGYQSVNDNQKNVANIFSLINKDENYIKESEQIHHSTKNKIINERPSSYDKNLIFKTNNLESNKMINSPENKSEIKVNFHLKEPYNLSFKSNVKKNITVLELKKRICQSLVQINKECISLNSNSFFLMKNYNFIKEFGRIDESNICDGDDIYIILKENIKKCQNEV